MKKSVVYKETCNNSLENKDCASLKVTTGV
jgi:hypothetical protein